MAYNTPHLINAMPGCLEPGRQHVRPNPSQYIHTAAEDSAWNQLGYQFACDPQYRPADEVLLFPDATILAQFDEFDSTTPTSTDEPKGRKLHPLRYKLPKEGRMFKCPFCSLAACKRDFEVFQHCREIHLDEHIAIELGIIVKCKSEGCNFHGLRRSRGACSRFSRHIATEHAGNAILYWKAADLDSEGRNSVASKDCANDWILKHFDELLARYDPTTSPKQSRRPRAWHLPSSGRISKPKTSSKRHSQPSGFAQATPCNTAGRPTKPQLDKRSALQRSPFLHSAAQLPARQRHALPRCLPPQPNIMTEWLNDPLHDDGYQLPTLPDCGFRDTFTFSDLSAIVPASNAMEPQLMHTPMLGHGWEPSFQCSSATALTPSPSDDTPFYSPAVASPTSSIFSGLLEAPGMFTYDEQVELLNPLWAYLCDDEASDGGPSDYGRQWDVESAVDWLM